MPSPINKVKFRTVNQRLAEPDVQARKMSNFIVMKPLEPNMMDEYQAKMIKQREGDVKRVPVGQSGFVVKGRKSMY